MQRLFVSFLFFGSFIVIVALVYSIHRCLIKRRRKKISYKILVNNDSDSSDSENEDALLFEL